MNCVPGADCPGADQWLNTQLYTPLELFLFAGGCFLWVIVYGIYIRNARRDHYIEMPVFAACGNIGWEFSWSFVCKTNMGLLLQYCYMAWFFFDIFIFTFILRYGWKQLVTPQLRPRRTYVTLCILSAVCWAVSVALFGRVGLDTPIGANSAYIAQLGISILYIILVLRQESLEKFSWTVCWMRTLGTGMNTVFMNIYQGYTDNYFLRFIAILATATDIACCIVFWIKWKRELASAGSPQSAPLSAPA